ADDVIVDCQHLHVADHSAIVAFETLQDRYRKAGKRLQFANLSPRNQHILQRAGVSIANA
ncbi:sodium-independent anion transporter, partial [Caballeronia sp. INML3]